MRTALKQHYNRHSFHPLCHLGWWASPMLHCGLSFSFFFFFPRPISVLELQAPLLLQGPPSINKAAPPIVAHITPFTAQLSTFHIEFCSRHPTCLTLNLLPRHAIVGRASEHLHDQPSFAPLLCFALRTKEIQHCVW